MEKFKAFLKGKKIDKHFKKSGQGASLSGPRDSTRTPSAHLGSSQGQGGVDRVAAADIAAQAALKRFYSKEEPKSTYGQKKIQMIARRELEEEKKASGADVEDEMKRLGVSPAHVIDEREFEHSDVIKGVFYTCELLGDDVALSKQELQSVIEEFLREQMASSDVSDIVIPAVMMLYTVNKKEPRQRAVETITKYIQNIAENPGETKYQRIRLSNKAFQERVGSVKGGREVLYAVGFEEQMEGDPPEAFLVIPEDKAADVGRLVSVLESLREGQPVPIKVARDTKAFIVAEGARVPMPQLPDDFFELTTEELKREQQMRSEEAERQLALRTRDMRQRDATLRNYKYKYTLLRVRCPDRLVIQGTFGCYENLSAVREWLCNHLAHKATPFQLRHANGVLTDDKAPLCDVGLAPAAVLHLDWDEPVDGPSLEESLLVTVEPLDV